METCTANPLTAEKKTELFKKDKKTHTVWLSRKTEKKKIQYLKDFVLKDETVRDDVHYKSLAFIEKGKQIENNLRKNLKTKNQLQKSIIVLCRHNIFDIYFVHLNLSHVDRKMNFSKTKQNVSKVRRKLNLSICVNFPENVFLNFVISSFLHLVSNDQFHANPIPYGTRSNGRVLRQLNQIERLKESA